MKVKKTVENVVQAKAEVEALVRQGYAQDDIYIFAHDQKRGDHITEALDTEKIGIKEQGMIEAMKNFFQSRGDQLRSKMQAAGLTEAEADFAEKELDEGKLIIIAQQS